MKRWILLLCLVGVPLVAGASLFVFGGARRFGGPTLWELRGDEIRPMVEQITGKRLPDKANDLRAITFAGCGIEELYLMFHTDQDGCSYVLQQFGVEASERYDFPDDDGYDFFPWSGLPNFERGFEFQKKLGVALFDNTRYERVSAEAVQRIITGAYPDDAVSGHYLHFCDDTQPLVMAYQILVFPDRGIVYMCAVRRPKGLVLP